MVFPHLLPVSFSLSINRESPGDSRDFDVVWSIIMQNRQRDGVWFGAFSPVG